MKETQISATASDQQKDEDGINLLELLTALAKNKKQLIGWPLLAGVAAAVISFAVPNVYKANTKILPPQQAQAGAAAILSQLGGVASAAAGAAGIKNPNDLYIGMLASRRISDKLIERFDLRTVYGTKSIEQARNKLKSNTTITTGKDGLILIEVEDEGKQRVAEIANAYTDELLKLTKVLALTEASQRRMFFERQLENSKNNLANAEMTLKKTIEANGIVSVDSDSRAIVETVSRLRAQISAKEIQLNSMQSFLTPNNQEYKRAQEELHSLRNEFNRLQNGTPGKSVAQEGENKAGGLENIKIVREVKYHQMLYELLSKQYEVARLDEAKDSSIIQVLDAAVEPERKYKPMRAIISIMTTIAAFFLTICWILIVETQRKAQQSPERAAQWSNLRASLRWK